MAGFAKLFGSIVTSSVWCEDDATLRVWIAMLATCDHQGVVEGSVPGFANLARVSVEQIERAIGTLSSPDSHSRTPDHEGRRIEAIPGGWKLLNYQGYRDRGQGKEGSRAPYMRDRRKKGNALQPDATRGTEAEDRSRRQKRTTDTPPPPTGGAAEVFAHWLSVMGHATAKLTPGRRKCIDARLREGYTPDQLKQAIDGCKGSAYHQGQNDRAVVYDDLTLICRNGEKVEQFLGYLRKPTAALVKAGASKATAFPSRTEKNLSERERAIRMVKGGAA